MLGTAADRIKTSCQPPREKRPDWPPDWRQHRWRRLAGVLGSHRRKADAEIDGPSSPNSSEIPAGPLVFIAPLWQTQVRPVILTGTSTESGGLGDHILA